MEMESLYQNNHLTLKIGFTCLWVGRGDRGVSAHHVFLSHVNGESFKMMSSSRIRHSKLTKNMPQAN